MLNTLVICRTRYNALRHNPLELIWALNFLAIYEADGTYTIKKNQISAVTGNVTSDTFESIFAFYK